MKEELAALSLEEKRKLAQQMLQRTKQQEQARSHEDIPEFARPTFDMFMFSSDVEPTEMRRFTEWVRAATEAGRYTFETPRMEAQRPENVLVRENGDRLPVINFASYNYLGYSYHAEVIAAAKAALDRYGLGVSSSPIAGGTIKLHKDLEERLLDFIGLDGYGVSLFTAGYCVNSGTIPAFIKPGGHVVVDQSAHMSIMEGAQLSRGEVHIFRHNDVQHLDEILREIKKRGPSRVLVCAEGVYSSDGDYGDMRGIVQTARRYGAKVLVDEAHSILVTGPGGKGICAEQGVLDQIDLFVITFSKAFGGIGGALIARKEITQYVNWYARCRMFSCALDPAVTGGILRALELGMGDDGDYRRRVLRDNAEYLRGLLKDRLNVGSSQSWIIPVIYGSDQRTLLLTDAMQRAGLETSIVQFPAVPKDLSRMRLFVTSEHTRAQMDRAAEILMRAARQFDFQKV